MKEQAAEAVRPALEWLETQGMEFGLRVLSAIAILLAGALVIIFKCLLKFPMTSTAFVGELTDILLGLCYVLPASILYMRKKDRKHALLGLLLGTFAATAAAILVNRFISVPFYVELFFKGDFNAIVGVCSVLYPSITKDSFYRIYLSAGVLPFNILRLTLVSIITFLVYKRLSGILHWEIKAKKAPAEDETSTTDGSSSSVQSDVQSAECVEDAELPSSDPSDNTESDR